MYIWNNNKAKVKIINICQSNHNLQVILKQINTLKTQPNSQSIRVPVNSLQYYLNHFSGRLRPVRECYSWGMTPSCLWRCISIYYTKIMGCAKKFKRQKLTLPLLRKSPKAYSWNLIIYLCFWAHIRSFKPCFII